MENESLHSCLQKQIVREEKMKIPGKCCFSTGGTITAHASTNHQGYMPGQTILINAHIKNDTGRAMQVQFFHFITKSPFNRGPKVVCRISFSVRCERFFLPVRCSRAPDWCWNKRRSSTRRRASASRFEFSGTWRASLSTNRTIGATSPSFCPPTASTRPICPTAASSTSAIVLKWVSTSLSN